MNIGALIVGLFTRKGSSPEPVVSPEQPAGPTVGEVIMPQERRFQVGEREVIIRPLVIADFERVAGDLGVIAKRIINEHPEIEITKVDQHLDVLMPIIAEWIGRILERLVGLEETYVKEHLMPVTAMQIVTAMLEVNQWPVIVGNWLRARQIFKTVATV